MTTEAEYFPDKLKRLLKKHKLYVQFEKKDGTIRDMKCTLAENAIPSHLKPTSETYTESLHAIRVFDIEKNEWRSFRYNSVLQYYII